MRTFIGKYDNGHYIYSNQNEAIKAQLVSILNTPVGSRFYMPSYGSRLNEYRFSVLNYFTINMIAQEIKNAVQFMTDISLVSMSYFLDNNNLKFTIDLSYMSSVVRVDLAIADGVAS